MVNIPRGFSRTRGNFRELQAFEKRQLYHRTLSFVQARKNLLHKAGRILRVQPGARSGVFLAFFTLGIFELRQLLGYETRMEVDAFLQRHGVELEYTLEDLERDRETHRKLGL